MNRQYFVQKWKKRLRLFFHLPFSNQALKFFPPEFTIRNPIMSLLNKARNQGHTCGLLLLHLEGYNKIMLSYPARTIAMLQKQVQLILTELLPEIYGDEHVIGVELIHDEDCCVYIRSRGKELIYEELYAKGLQVRKLLEMRLKNAMNIEVASHLQIQTAVHILDPHILGTKFAAKAAYHYALAIATKKLPAHFGSARQQLLNIVNNADITVLAQPIISFATGEIFGWEILTRGPQNSPFHLPTELFSFAYQADVLSDMEFLVFSKAFQKIMENHIQEQVFINVTAVTLCHPLFVRRMAQLLEQFPAVHAQQIVIELTERHFVSDFNHVAAIMAKCREQGFRFAVDDAGAGYSSLQSISELIPDIIKIDKSVIQNIDQVAVKESMLKALLSFAENINCQVIAEGIERAEEADILFKHEVHMGQGYYFAEPSPLLFNIEKNELEKMKEKIRGLRNLMQEISPKFI